MYAWGNNFNSQLGLEPSIFGDLVSKPTRVNIIPKDSSKMFRQVSAGNLHSVAYSSYPLNPNLLQACGVPAKIPEKYEILQHIPTSDLRSRLTRLNEISNFIKSSWRLLPRNYCQADLQDPLSLDRIRQVLNPSVYHLPLVRTLQVSYKTFCPRTIYPQTVSGQTVSGQTVSGQNVS